VLRLSGAAWLFSVRRVLRQARGVGTAASNSVLSASAVVAVAVQDLAGRRETRAVTLLSEHEWHRREGLA
jgi:hypothetical protein